jgi:hypothetical protein
MTKTSCADSALMSPRTVKYVEAMIREGENFDYCEWLKRTRDYEQGQTNLTSDATASPEAMLAQSGQRPSTLNGPDCSVHVAPMIPLRRPEIQSIRKLRDRVAKAPQERWLEEVRDAWHKFQANRRRDAVYGYLEAVFAIVAHYRVRRRTKRLLRHASTFAHLPFDRNSDPFAAVIRCTCSGRADNKTISKWARALRYAAIRKPPEMRLKAFMKGAGGVNACADRHAKYFGRGGR